LEEAAGLEEADGSKKSGGLERAVGLEEAAGLEEADGSKKAGGSKRGVGLEEAAGSEEAVVWPIGDARLSSVPSHAAQHTAWGSFSSVHRGHTRVIMESIRPSTQNWNGYVAVSLLICLPLLCTTHNMALGRDS
jgi:hypothetical protein